MRAEPNPVVAPGNRIVSVFDQQGNFIRRFASNGSLNAPWGIVQASADFGRFSNDMLIGNFGGGTINAFDPASEIFSATSAIAQSKDSFSPIL